MSEAQHTGQDDPRYRNGMAHLQNGAWQEAIHCFEELLKDYPETPSLQQALEEARFKANLSTKTRVKSKSRFVVKRAVILRFVIITVFVAAAVQAVIFYNNRITPSLAQAQVQRRQAKLLADGNAYLTAGDLERAEQSFKSLLTEVPDHKEGSQGLAQVTQQRELLKLYQEAVAYQDLGQYEQALAKLTEVYLRSARYRDVNVRLATVQRRLDLDKLFDQAQEAGQADKPEEALAKYRQIRDADPTYRSDRVVEQLVALHLKLGRALLAQLPPDYEKVGKAADYFGQALALAPRNAEATYEQRLAWLYLEGEAAYRERRWDDAATPLQTAYDIRADYLGGAVIGMLFNTYVHSGDQYRASDQGCLALAAYRKAVKLPVAERDVIQQRIAEIEQKTPCQETPVIDESNLVTTILTETATIAPTSVLTSAQSSPVTTATITATATATFTPTTAPAPTFAPTAAPTTKPTARPTAQPTLVPPTSVPPTPVPPTSTPQPTPLPTLAPLAEYHGMIAFFSTQKDRAGLWLMDARGQDRRYLGDSAALKQQYEQLVAQSRVSPDGKYNLVVPSVGATTQIFIAVPKHPQYGDLPAVQLTRLGGSCDDPVWSPSGTRIAFRGQENGNDDIWLINPDGTGLVNLTHAEGADRHPAWSPDGARLVFCSDRSKQKRLYVMNADGQGLEALSRGAWDEYDPVWIK